MREELFQKIMILIMGEDIPEDKRDRIANGVTITLNNYDITLRETAVAVRSENINADYLKSFLAAKMVTGRTERTLDYYKKTISFVLREINKPADEITTDDIRFYLALRQKRDGVMKITADNELRAMRSFYAYLTAEEKVLKNPCLRIERIKTDKIQKEAFTELEVEKIRAACKTARETAIVELLLSTGCRVTELARILLSDVKEDRIIVHGKGNKDRIVYINAKAQLALQSYMKERKDTNPYLLPKGIWCPKSRIKGVQGLWYTDPKYVDKECSANNHIIQHTVNHIGKRAGVEKCHPHRFRRTCATFALRRGMPIEQVSKMLGHESIRTTQIYLDLSEEELQQAHKKYVV